MEAMDKFRQFSAMGNLRHALAILKSHTSLVTSREANLVDRDMMRAGVTAT